MNVINNFDMIGWTDPVNPNPNKTVKWLKSLTHDNYVYPQSGFNPEKPTPCIFKPDVAILNKMIETVARN